MIDSNQTRYHLLLGKADWARCDQDGGASAFALDAQGSEVFSWNPRSELTLGARANFFYSALRNVPPLLDQRRGAGQDRFGNWYWIGPSKTELLVTSCGTGVTTHFWSSTDECGATCSPASGFVPVQPVTSPKALVFSGLAVTTEHYLVVGVLEPAGLVVFDLFHGGPPRQFVWPKNIPFVPFDMAPAPDGGVWVLDRQNRRYWALDRAFSVIRQDQSDLPISQYTDVFVPVDGTAPTKPKPTFPSGITLGLSSPITAFDPIAIEALPDNSVLFLESDPGLRFSRIHHYRFGTELGVPVSLDLILSVILSKDRAAFSLRGFDFAFIATETVPEGTRQNTLYIVAQSGDQAWAFQADFTGGQLVLRAIPEYRPMRLFSGIGIVTGQTQVFYDSQNRWIPLVMQRRPRYVESAALVSPVFDAKEPDSVWHRLMLDAVLPTDTAIRVFTRAGNGEEALAAAPWNEEPSPYRRSTGIELPWTALPAGLGTWETLFQNATGRYIQIRLLLSGNGRTSPAIYALRAYYPRFSYLKSYLPAVYRQHKTSASFLDRFLANFEGTLTTIEDKIASVQELFDPASAPADTLDWLANWFGVGLDPAWTEAKRRLFLQNAATFFEARGTLLGLMMALRLAVDNCVSAATFSAPLSDAGGPRIVEKFRTRNVPIGMYRTSDATFGLPLELKTGTWTPSQGADELDQLYRTSLRLTGSERYPLSLPTNNSNYAAWTKFSQNTLGFLPAPPSRLDAWTLFLRNQYRVISLLNAVYHTNYGSFEDVPFPQALPRQLSPLSDWYHFQGLLLVRSSAHQFTIFLPMPLGDAQDVSAQRAKVNLARRVVELEKPAHTEFSIQFFWAFFRLGETRLGKETLLDQSSRAPQLLRPALLGDTYIGSSYVRHSKLGQPRQRHLLESGADNATPCRTRNCKGGQA